MPQDKPSSGPDYYARLGVQPSASADEIREAYREKAQATHPDQNPDDPEAAERFQKVKEAYRVLGDPERRKKYDEARRARRVPEILHMTHQAPAGCGGYLWRVFAGLAAVAVFFVLEALGVWSAGTWTIVLAIGGAALLAGLVTSIVADRFPDQATDVSLRLDSRRLTMWADGRTALQLSWSRTRAVRLGREGEWTMELVVDPIEARGLRPIPPVLTAVDRRSDHVLLRLDLSDTDVPRDVLGSFLQSTDTIPFPAVET